MRPSQETIAGRIQALLKGRRGSWKCSSHKESWLALKGSGYDGTQLSFSPVSGTLGVESITMGLLWDGKLRKQVSGKLAGLQASILLYQPRQVGSRRYLNFQSVFG